MATQVFTTEEIELQDGTEVTLKPLNIKSLREFMKIVEKMDNISDENEEESIDIMVDACAVAIRRDKPELADDKEKLEEALDVPTMWKILEVAGGVTIDQNPNLPRAALSGQS